MSDRQRHLVSIGIPTRNRWDVLYRTLEKIREFGLGDIAIHILDNASDEPFDAPRFSRLGLDLRVERSERNLGAPGARNRLTRWIETPYYLSLDDDSYPVQGDLVQAVAYCERNRNERLFGLTFPIKEGPPWIWRTKTLHPEPYPTRVLWGCGQFVIRERFLEVGGYADWLAHQKEELELALNACSRGMQIIHYPGLEIQHEYTSVHRQWDMMAFGGARNELAIWYVYAPWQLLLPKLIKYTSYVLWSSARQRRVAFLKGWVAGMMFCFAHRKLRKPLELHRFLEFWRLP